MPKYIEVNIKKPLFGSFVYIRDRYINESKRTGKPLKITIPQGSAIMSAQEWLKDAKYLEQVFKRPDQPMKLWGNYVPLNSKPVIPLTPVPQATQLELGW